MTRRLACAAVVGGALGLAVAGAVIGIIEVVASRAALRPAGAKPWAAPLDGASHYAGSCPTPLPEYDWPGLRS